MLPFNLLRKILGLPYSGAELRVLSFILFASVIRLEAPYRKIFIIPGGGLGRK